MTILMKRFVDKWVDKDSNNINAGMKLVSAINQRNEFAKKNRIIADQPKENGDIYSWYESNQ